MRRQKSLRRSEAMSGILTPGAIHFFRFDKRFCGTQELGRRVTLDPNEVTCEGCMSRDTFVLSPEGAAYVAELQKQAKRNG